MDELHLNKPFFKKIIYSKNNIVYCGVYYIFRIKTYGNNSIKHGKGKLEYATVKFSHFYMKWYNII